MIPTTHYTFDQVKEDVRALFLDDNHWAFQYGTPTPDCNKDCPFSKKQIQILFEDRYPHDFTGKAVIQLINEKFLLLRRMPVGDIEVHFVYRHNLRYVVRLMKGVADTIQRYSEHRISKATGEYAEMLFEFMFRLNGFKIVGRNTRQYRDIKWTQTENDLDFIIEKDGITYGIEIKNTFDYMHQRSFKIK